MNQFNILFNNLKSKKVLIYGTGVWCHRLIDGLKDTASIVGILDRDKIEGQIDGIPILTWERIQKGSADAIIIASRQQFYKEIYSRIISNCSQLELDVYSANGRNMRLEQSFADNLKSNFVGGLFVWYKYKTASDVLIVSDSKEDFEIFKQRCVALSQCYITGCLVTELTSTDFLKKYDYVICLSLLEKQKSITDCFSKIFSLLKDSGIFLFGMNNRFGIRFFCGDKDLYSDSVMDSIDNYRNIPKQKLDKMSGRCYAKSEIKNLLSNTGFIYSKFYSVFPDLVMPSLIYADGFNTKEELNIRYHPKYNSPETLFLEEEPLLTDLIDNNLFHPMANAFLIECSKNKCFENANHVTLTLERDDENALATIIRSDNTVEKMVLFSSENEKFLKLVDNSDYLKKRGIKVVDGVLEDNCYKMPFIDAPTGVAYFNKLFFSDKDLLIRKLDEFRQIVLSSSEWVSGNPDDDDGVILKKGFIDLVALNCFVIDDNFYFYDQEFCFDNLPANVIIWRTLTMLYGFGNRKEEILPMSFFSERYHLAAKFDEWGKISALFTDTLRNEEPLKDFNRIHERRNNHFLQNRIVMNSPDYDFLIKREDIFRPVGNRKLVLFGAGKYAGKFIEQFGKEYEIVALVDNDSEKWGTQVYSLPVISPESLKDYNPAEYYLIICTAYFEAIEKQIAKMEIPYGIYTPGRLYPKYLDFNKKENIERISKKKYHIGYMPGVFDLYHYGHLRMFQRAKELCDYLIVGLETDEWVRLAKHKDPFVSFEERKKLLESCMYVDKVVEIPTYQASTLDAYKMYNFDVIFSGSDHQNEKSWIDEKLMLEKLGATVRYFSYTDSTSSTKLRQLIDKALI